MSKLSYIQKRIRACDRILRKEYWNLKHAIRERQQNDTDEYEDSIQERINYYEEALDRLEISL